MVSFQYCEFIKFVKLYAADDFFEDKTELSDGELFDILYRLISEGELKEPYFLGVYNLGTHTGRDAQENAYRGLGTVVSPLLNRMHNFDVVFGSFLDRFDENEELNSKTSLIFTADHATWRDAEYMYFFKDFGDSGVGVLNRIPFVLYDRNVVAQRMDANYKNSLDFAPTLLNWLRINEAHNYFLGCSL